MKNTIILFLAFLGIMAILSCKKNTTTICKNLLSEGITNSNSLIGEWKFNNFACTPNGKKINNKNNIDIGYISVTDTGHIWLYHTNSFCYEYVTVNSNELTVILKEATKINSPKEEEEIAFAFKDIKCYSIKDNKLLLHYSNNDNKNILILTKK
jgi:hypothetical protein